MTITSVAPTGNTNEEQAPTQAIDNMGNPIDAEGNPITPDAKAEEGEVSIESLQKALKDTKAELTRLQQERNAATDDDTVEIEGNELEEQEARQAVTDSGLDFNKYSKELNESGKLTDESYEELAGKGFTRDIVDAYIEGQKAKHALQIEEVSQVVGGQENLPSVLEWAGKNLTAEEINIYNQAVAMGTAAAKLALQGVYARYTAANGKQPNLIKNGSASTSSDVFKSPYDMQKAMDDPKYWSDPDYQKEVQEKVKRSYAAKTI